MTKKILELNIEHFGYGLIEKLNTSLSGDYTSLGDDNNLQINSVSRYNLSDYEVPVIEGTVPLYSVEVNFAKEFDDKFLMDDKNWMKYSFFKERGTASQLMRTVRSRAKASKDFPVIFFSLYQNLIPENELKPKLIEWAKPLFNTITKEEICINGEIKNDSISYHEGGFVRQLYLCDIIKNWDYEPF